jgi:hypothetical protein
MENARRRAASFVLAIVASGVPPKSKRGEGNGTTRSEAFRRLVELGLRARK